MTIQELLFEALMHDGIVSIGKELEIVLSHRLNNLKTKIAEAEDGNEMIMLRNQYKVMKDDLELLVVDPGNFCLNDQYLQSFARSLANDYVKVNYSKENA